jgi:hypothetical protein
MQIYLLFQLLPIDSPPYTVKQDDVIFRGDVIVDNVSIKELIKKIENVKGFDELSNLIDEINELKRKCSCFELNSNDTVKFTHDVKLDKELLIKYNSVNGDNYVSIRDIIGRIDKLELKTKHMNIDDGCVGN